MTVELQYSPFIRTIKDYPKPGVDFYDITPLLKDPLAFQHFSWMMAEEFYQKELDDRITAVAGIEARGFIFGAAMAYRLGVGFIPVRKDGKLPHDKYAQEYELEYGSDILEIHSDAALEGERILIVDDVLATGGTAEAAIKLFNRAGAEIVGFACLIELLKLGGRKRVEDTGIMVSAQQSFK